MTGDDVKRIRQSLGLTQTEFADKINISAAMVSLIELNERGIKKELREAIQSLAPDAVAESRAPYGGQSKLVKEFLLDYLQDPENESLKVRALDMLREMLV